MIEDSFSPLRLSRKTDLQVQIEAAINLKDQTMLETLQAKWVHRYGFGTMPLRVEANPLQEAIEFKNDSAFKGEAIYSTDNELNPSLINEVDNTKVLNQEGIAALDEVCGISSEEKQSSTSQNTLLASPPPPPTLNQLRRWLPVVDDELIKTS